MVQQLIQLLALLVENVWRCTDVWTTDRSDLDALAADVRVYALLEGINHSFHWSKKAFGLETVVEVCSADASPQDMGTYGVERNLLFWKVLPV